MPSPLAGRPLADPVTRGGRKPKILVLDGAASWVRNLFEAMPSSVQVDYLDPVSLGFQRRPSQWWLRRKRQCWRSAVLSFPVPGWTRFERLSTEIVIWYVRSYLLRYGSPLAVVHNLPWLAGVAERFPGLTHVYHAHDCFRNYSWDLGRSSISKNACSMFATSP